MFDRRMWYIIILLMTKDKFKRIRSRRLYWLRKYKQFKGCENCGYNENPLALDFAHIDQMTKHPDMVNAPRGNGINRLYTKIRVNRVSNRAAIRTLFKEIRLCKILCKNCHVIETYNNGEFERSRDVSHTRKTGIERTPITSTQADLFA